MSVTVKSQREIELMREAGKILGTVLNELEKECKPGVTTYHINKIGEEMIKSYGCIPSFKGYQGYPAAICVSVNDEIVHGIPSKKRVLKEGDIVSLDAGVIHKGYHSDAARTYGIGKISDEAAKLIEVSSRVLNMPKKDATYMKSPMQLHNIMSRLDMELSEIL